MPISLIDFVQGLISDNKQIDGELAILTVNRVGVLSARGALDFGGSEYDSPTVKWLTPVKQSDDDDYGWWNLEEGSYQLELNETIVPHDAHPVVLQTWPAALRAGVSHDTVMITEKTEHPTLQLHVPKTGIAIKENARMTSAIPILTLTT